MVLAGALGLVLTLAALREGGGERRILVAGRDLESGSVIGPEDLQVETVRMGAELADRFVSARDAARVRGRVLVAASQAGDPLLATHVRARPTEDGRRAMSIPVDRSRAVNGRLAAGDRVDVVAAQDGVATVVAAGLEVLDLDDGDQGAFGARRGEVTLTLAVDVRDSQLLAAVLADGEFVLTRVTGARSAAGVAPLEIDGGNAKR